MQGVPKKIGFRKVAQFSPRGVWAVKIWVFWGAEHIYAITRCLAHVLKVLMSLCEPPFIPLHTSEWPFDQRFCYIPKANFILGHPVDFDNKMNWTIWSDRAGLAVNCAMLTYFDRRREWHTVTHAGVYYYLLPCYWPKSQQLPPILLITGNFGDNDFSFRFY